MAGYQSEAQEVTGRGSAFPHNTCAVRKGSGYPRRGLKMPLRYQKSAPCPQAYTHTGTMGRHKKATYSEHFAHFEQHKKLNWRKCLTIKKSICGFCGLSKRLEAYPVTRIPFKLLRRVLLLIQLSELLDILSETLPLAGCFRCVSV